MRLSSLRGDGGRAKEGVRQTIEAHFMAHISPSASASSEDEVGNKGKGQKRRQRRRTRAYYMPASVRPSLWRNLSGAAEDAEKNEGLYRRLCDAKISKRLLMLHSAAIQRDMHRTFTLFRRDPTAPKIYGRGSKTSSEMWEASLVRILRAIVIHVPDVGYHQGLNFLAAALLMIVHGVEGGKAISEETEETSFWILVSLLQRYGFAGLFTTSTSFLQQYMDRFDRLMVHAQAALHQHLMSVQWEPAMYCMEWFTTTFVYSLQFSCAIFLFDAIILTSIPDVMYLAGISILSCLSDRLMLMNGNDIMENFKAMTKAIDIDTFRGAFVMNFHRLVPSTLVPLGQQTLLDIGRAFADPTNNISPDFDASALFEAVQLGDDATVDIEVAKYTFPVAVLERALYRACLLGHASVAIALLRKGRAHPDCPTMLCDEFVTPLHLCALLGHSTLARVLLAAGASTLSRASLRTCPALHHIAVELAQVKPVSSASYEASTGALFTPFEWARAVAFACYCKGGDASKDMTYTSATAMVIGGDVCVWCGTLLSPSLFTKPVGMISLVVGSLFKDRDAKPRAVGDHEVGCCSECERLLNSAEYSEARGCRPHWEDGRHIHMLSCACAAIHFHSRGERWKCNHCDVVFKAAAVSGLSTSQSYTCARCGLQYCCDCANRMRRLLPDYPHPVRVCCNCHHTLRSCPCPKVLREDAMQAIPSPLAQRHIRRRKRHLLCDHVSVDYACSATAPSRTYCRCYECTHRTFSVRSPLLGSLCPGKEEAFLEALEWRTQASMLEESPLDILDVDLSVPGKRTDGETPASSIARELYRRGVIGDRELKRVLFSDEVFERRKKDGSPSLAPVETATISWTPSSPKSMKPRDLKKRVREESFRMISRLSERVLRMRTDSVTSAEDEDALMIPLRAGSPEGKKKTSRPRPSPETVPEPPPSLSEDEDCESMHSETESGIPAAAPLSVYAKYRSRIEDACLSADQGCDAYDYFTPLSRYYAVHNPRVGADALRGILKSYEGREAELWLELERAYGERPGEADLVGNAASSSKTAKH